MNNVVFIRRSRPETAPATDDREMSRKMLRTALNRLHAFARTEGLGNTAMTLELAMTALDVDYDRERG